MLLSGVQGITDLITTPGLINLDFADVKSVMSGAGSALMGIGSARGDNRARKAAEIAIASPLLEASMEGAHGVLLSIYGGSDLGLFEINEAASLVAEAAHPDANIIFGAVIDDTLGDEVKVTVIAAGFDSGQLPYKKVDVRRAHGGAGAGPGARACAERTGPDAGMATSAVWHRPRPRLSSTTSSTSRTSSRPDRRSPVTGGTEPDRRAELLASLERLRARIADACASVGRDPDELTLIAVTKTFPVSDVALLGELGVPDIGESRDQEARAKVASVARCERVRPRTCAGTSSGGCRRTSAGRWPATRRGALRRPPAAGRRTRGAARGRPVGGSRCSSRSASTATRAGAAR